jgi:hypothetical protein
MGWRDRVKGSSAPRQGLRLFLLEGEEVVQTVGESFYQQALLRHCRVRRGDAVRVTCRATLVPQPDNPYDSNAVAVQIGGELVGHLARKEAPRWQPIVRTLADRGYVATCEAMIAGRGHQGETDNLGVFLHLPALSEARSQVSALGD